MNCISAKRVVVGTRLARFGEQQYPSPESSIAVVNWEDFCHGG